VKHSLPNSEKEHQWSVNDCWPSIIINNSVMWPLWSIYIVWLFFCSKRLNYTEWLLRRWNTLLLSRKMWHEYPVHICPYRLPYHCLWMLVIKHHLYYQRCKFQNCSHSVDAYFKDVVVHMSQFDLLIDMANMSTINRDIRMSIYLDSY